MSLALLSPNLRDEIDERSDQYNFRKDDYEAGSHSLPMHCAFEAFLLYSHTKREKPSTRKMEGRYRLTQRMRIAKTVIS